MIDRRGVLFLWLYFSKSREAAMQSLNPFSLIFGVLIAVFAASAHGAEISGPQVGDKITSFTVRGVLDDEAGKNIDLVKDAAGKPLVIFFVHERTRPSIGLARQVLSDAANRKSDGLEAGLVLLTSDVTATEEWVKMVPQVLPRGVPIGISTDGEQGPPAYNLSRKVVATVIIAKDNRVVANFALNAPNLDEDPQKISSAIAATLGSAKP
jgi:hypothetical protein